MSLVGIISDTHGRISNEALEALAGVDFIIHAGDIGSLDVLMELEAIAPTIAVLGNNDYNVDYGPGVHESATQIIDGVRLFVSHHPRDAERAAESGSMTWRFTAIRTCRVMRCVVAAASSIQAAPSDRAVAPHAVSHSLSLRTAGSALCRV